MGALKEGVANPRYRACGVGVINNEGLKPKGVLCTDVNILDPATEDCNNPDGSGKYTLPDGGIFCIQWQNNDNNLCAGDFGGEKEKKILKWK